MNQAKSLVPAALSFIFRPFLKEGLWQKKHPYSYYADSGSTGIGATVNRQVEVTARRTDKNAIFFNGQSIDLPTVATALNFLDSSPLGIKINSPLPLGWGFGISGASALGALLSADALWKLKTPRSKLVMMAHAAEITDKTGLGTVATQTTGGFLNKLKPGIPPRFQKIRLTGRKLYAVMLGPIATKGILESPESLSRISKAADSALKKIREASRLGLDEILKLSYDYCRQSRLLTGRTESIIRKINRSGGIATMNILGEVVLANIPFGDHSFRQEELIITGEIAQLEK
ncbi:MAG: hypothetical protein UV73_C0011G0025 [Candidatus Gottesmanbacteria bacterium GW2011_GWA2_43_14]|uniref:GHMP kinase N-terminal domain-containing protein n=1 Tax=Candidatus Gottesmanbacteria bacterium GW2011_GWA2_43_14 TaxID=1618443 RepID=A0A0G1GBP5_9BACT|nr:MAG: hypothetical protein UV73_C0011G0025 [Candidatus Gottesmanbacteria bacterium GW2011_GWA2_43_14]